MRKRAIAGEEGLKVPYCGDRNRPTGCRSPPPWGAAEGEVGGQKHQHRVSGS